MEDVGLEVHAPPKLATIQASIRRLNAEQRRCEIGTHYDHYSFAPNSHSFGGNEERTPNGIVRSGHMFRDHLQCASVEQVHSPWLGGCIMLVVRGPYVQAWSGLPGCCYRKGPLDRRLDQEGQR